MSSSGHLSHTCQQRCVNVPQPANLTHDFHANLQAPMTFCLSGCAEYPFAHEGAHERAYESLVSCGHIVVSETQTL